MLLIKKNYGTSVYLIHHSSGTIWTKGCISGFHFAWDKFKNCFFILNVTVDLHTIDLTRKMWNWTFFFFQMVDDPFPDLHIADTSFLDTTESRHKCRKCTKSRKYFCYSCCEPMPQIKDKIPRVKVRLHCTVFIDSAIV